MTAANADLAMMALVVTILILVFAVIWFVFMVPMEKGLHDRRLQLIQRRLREKEEQMKRERREREWQDTSAEEVRERSHGTGRGN